MFDQPTDEQRHSRIELCRAYETNMKAIKQMPVTAAVQSELRVLFTAVHRMALLHNDGHVTPRELEPW